MGSGKGKPWGIPQQWGPGREVPLVPWETIFLGFSPLPCSLPPTLPPASRDFSSKFAFCTPLSIWAVFWWTFSETVDKKYQVDNFNYTTEPQKAFIGSVKKTPRFLGHIHLMFSYLLDVYMGPHTCWVWDSELQRDLHKAQDIKQWSCKLFCGSIGKMRKCKKICVILGSGFLRRKHWMWAWKQELAKERGSAMLLLHEQKLKMEGEGLMGWLNKWRVSENNRSV